MLTIYLLDFQIDDLKKMMKNKSGKLYIDNGLNGVLLRLENDILKVIEYQEDLPGFFTEETVLEIKLKSFDFTVEYLNKDKYKVIIK